MVVVAVEEATTRRRQPTWQTTTARRVVRHQTVAKAILHVLDEAGTEQLPLKTRLSGCTWSSISARKSLLPCCIFVFSKKRCEENADALSNLDFCTASEKSRYSHDSGEVISTSKDG